MIRIKMPGEAHQFLSGIVNNGGYVDYARQAHEAWRATKESQGWAYGPKRDDEEKTNPLMVPFDELPDDIKGQNGLTPYAVVNFLRINLNGRSLQDLDEALATIAEGESPTLTEQMGEYVHSHFVAAQLAKGESTATRKDMVAYEELDEETKSWDIQSALAVIEYLRELIHK